MIFNYDISLATLNNIPGILAQLEKRLAFVKGPYFCEQMHDRSPKQNGIQHENAHGCAHTGELCRG